MGMLGRKAIVITGICLLVFLLILFIIMNLEAK